MRTSSTAEVLPSSVPPAAPNATPANAAPSRMVLAARARERDTGQVYAPHRQPRERDPRQRGHTATEGEQPAHGREQPDRDQRQEQRQRKPVGRAREVEQPVRAGLDGPPADLETRLLVALGESVEGSLVLVARGDLRALGGGSGAAAARPVVASAALVRSARLGACDDRPAVAVLVEVRGKVLLGLVEVGVGVVVVQVAVVRAVADDRTGTRVREGRSGQCDEKDEDVGDATHVQIPPEAVSAGAWGKPAQPTTLREGERAAS